MTFRVHWTRVIQMEGSVWENEHNLSPLPRGKYHAENTLTGETTLVQLATSHGVGPDELRHGAKTMKRYGCSDGEYIYASQRETLNLYWGFHYNTQSRGRGRLRNVSAPRRVSDRHLDEVLRRIFSVGTQSPTIPDKDFVLISVIKHEVGVEHDWVTRMFAILEFAEPFDPDALIVVRRGSRAPAVGRGADWKILPLGFKIIEADEEDKECGICLEDVSTGDVAVALPCQHWFDDPCITEWLKDNNTRPKCRSVVEVTA